MLRNTSIATLLMTTILISAVKAQEGVRYQSRPYTAIQQPLNAARGPGNGIPNGMPRSTPQPVPRGQVQPEMIATPGAPVFSQPQTRFPIPYVPVRRPLNRNGYYLAPHPAKTIRKHDIVTVRVDMLSSMESEGNVEMRRNANYSAILSDWIIVDFFRWIKPSPQSNGDPTIAGTLNRQNRAEGDIDSSEKLQFNIAVEIVDIYPNGNLVLRGENFTRVNNEIWKISLSGICRNEDILPNNTVLSTNILNLKIDKEEHGQVRDSYRRGWFTRWFDRFHPF